MNACTAPRFRIQWRHGRRNKMRRTRTTAKQEPAAANQYKTGDVVCANIKDYPNGWPGIVSRVSGDKVSVYFKSDDDEFILSRKKIKPFLMDETEMHRMAKKMKNSETRNMFILDYEWARKKILEKRPGQEQGGVTQDPETGPGQGQGDHIQDPKMTPEHRQRDLTQAPKMTPGHRQGDLTQAPKTAPGHGQGDLTQDPKITPGHGQGYHTQDPKTAPGHGQGDITQDPKTAPGHRQGHLTQDPKTAPGHGQGHLTQDPKTAPGHGQGHLTQDPKTAPGHGQSDITQDPKTAPGHGQSHLTQDPKMTPGHGQGHLTQDPKTAPGHGQGDITQDPKTAPGHRQGDLTQDPKTAPGHGQGHLTQDPKTAPGHRQGDLTQDPKTAPGHGQGHLTQDPKTAPGHGQGDLTQDPKTAPGHGQGHLTQDPKTAPGHRQSDHTQDPKTAPGHGQSDHTQDPKMAPGHGQSDLTQDPKTAPGHRQGDLTQDPKTAPGHGQCHLTQDPKTAPGHRQSDHTQDPKTVPGHGQSDHTQDPKMAPRHGQSNLTKDPKMAPGHGQSDLTQDPKTAPGHGQGHLKQDPKTAPGHGQGHLTQDPKTAPGHGQGDHTQDPKMGPLASTDLWTMVLCPSGLNDDQMKNVREVCCKNNLKFSHMFNEDVTHVVIKTDPVGSRMCDRTMKWFKGIAKKCWVLDYQWIVDSVSSGDFLPEEDFEVIGDTVTKEMHNGPEKSRLAKSPLLKGYELYCYGRTSNISKDDLEDLVTCCGGSLLDPAKQVTPGSRKLAVACVDECLSDYDKVQVTTMTMGLQTVSHDWLLDSITVYEVQDLNEYLIIDKERQDGDINEMNAGVYEDDTDEDPDYQPSSDEEKQETESEEVYLEGEALYISGLESKAKNRKRKDNCNNQSDFQDQVEKRKSMVGIVSESDSDATTEVLPMLNGNPEKKRKSEINVQMAHNGNKRKWDKQHYCMYCGKSSTNIRKHYFSKKHKSESQVQRILSFSLHSKDRTLALEELRNAGDYKHNYEVIKSGDGTLVPWRNVNEETEASEMLPCEFCLAFFMKKELWRHHAVCKFRKKNPDQKKYRKVYGKAFDLLPCKTEVSEGFRTNILARMSGDQVSLAAKNDRIITQLGEKLYKKHGHLEHMYNYIGQKMREMARLLICIREEDSEIETIENLIEPKFFPLALKCVQTLCGFEEDTNRYRNPSLALKLGYSLKRCATIQKAHALIEENDEKRKKAENFIAVHELMWPNDVSSAALTTLKVGKWNKPSPLPLTKDVSKLQTLVKEKIQDLSTSLNNGIKTSKPDKNVYSQLSEVTLVKLVMFNRRRGGEAERLTIESYQQKSGNNAPIKDIEDSLTPMEKKMCSLFQRVEIRGKKGRRVPVLLTKDLIEAIGLLLKARESVGVSKENPYVFARMNYGSNKSIRASDALRKYAKMSGVEKIENITSTKLRKHIATVSQIMNFGSTDLEQLATFMGHDISVHRSFYRLPESTIQVAKLGKFLLALDSGEISKYSSCTLDEVTLDDDDVDVEDDQEGEDMDESSESDPGDSDDDELLLEQVTPGCSSTPRSGPCHSKTKGQVKVILDTRQQTCLKQIFKENISMRKELKMKECNNAIATNECLKGLKWKKIKNTVHNWIMNEKRKTKKMRNQ